MKRLGIATAALCVAVAGCGIQPTGVVSAGDPPKPSAPASTVVVYLVSSGESLAGVRRPGVPGHPEHVLHQLVTGPTPAEQQNGITTAMPDQVNLTYFRGGPRPVIMVGGPDGQVARGRLAWPRIAQAQLACTVYAISGEQSLVVTDEGVSEITPDGFQAFGPTAVIGCEQFDDLQPENVSPP